MCSNRWYIGEIECIGQGIGSKALELFLDIFVFPNFDAVFVDPDTANIAALRTYNKVGFKMINQMCDGEVRLMIKENRKKISIKTAS